MTPEKVTNEKQQKRPYSNVRTFDGTFTHPYICYFDTEGNAHAPSLLPQKNPMHYDLSTKSYNLPELITGKVKVTPYQFAETARGKAIEVKMR